MSKIEVGILSQERIHSRWCIETDIQKTPGEYAYSLLEVLETKNLEISAIRSCAILSYVPSLTRVFEILVKDHFNQVPLIIDWDFNPPSSGLSDFPKETLLELAVNTAGARCLLSGPMILVIFGLATTLCAISAEGKYESIVTAPGITPSAEGLFHRVAGLINYDLKSPGTILPADSLQSVKAGLVYGFASMVEGMVKRIRAGWDGNARVIATGEYSRLIATETDVIDIVEPDLALLGMKQILLEKQQRFQGVDEKDGSRVAIEKEMAGKVSRDFVPANERRWG